MAEQAQVEHSEAVAPSIEDRVLNLFEPKTSENEEEAPVNEEAESEVPAESQDKTEETKDEEKKDDLPEAVEVEYEGKNYRIAPELKDALMRQSDYTKKTQEAAEIRRTADTLLQQAGQMAELQKAFSKQLGQLANIDDQIAQYEKVDWNQLTAQDGTKAQQLFIAFQQAKDSRAKLVQELGNAHTQQMQARQSALQARLEEGHKALARDIKGWNADLGKKLMDFGMKTYGFTAEEAASVTDHRTVKLLHDANQWHQLQASKASVEKRANVAPKTLKPQASETRAPGQQETEALRRAVRSSKTDSEKSKLLEQLIARKFR